LATIAIIEKEKLPKRANRLGAHLLSRLEEMKANHDLVGDVRGIGLLTGMDLVTDRRSKNRAVAAADQLMVACLRRGLSFKTSQGSFIPLSPPLNIARADLDDALNILATALAEVAGRSV
jgi:4-aminobutyrate aminotransferase